MPNVTTNVHVEGVGPVKLRSDQRCKRLSIRIKPFEGVVAMFPPGFSPKKALAFVEEKKGWIRQNLKKIEASENKHTIFDEYTPFRTRTFELKVHRETREDIRLKLENGILRVSCPDHINMADAPVQEAIRDGIERAMRIEAKNVLPRKVRHFAEQHHFRPEKVFIKNLTSADI